MRHPISERMRELAGVVSEMDQRAAALHGPGNRNLDVDYSGLISEIKKMSGVSVSMFSSTPGKGKPFHMSTKDLVGEIGIMKVGISEIFIDNDAGSKFVTGKDGSARWLSKVGFTYRLNDGKKGRMHLFDALYDLDHNRWSFKY